MRWILGTALIVSMTVASTAQSQECAATIEGNDAIQFSAKEMTVDSSCESFTVTLKHVGTLPVETMGHNWVLAKTADYQSVAVEGGAVGGPDYLVPDDPRVIAATDTIGGGEETSVTFDPSMLDVGGDYTFVCTFPGHFALMNGKLIVQ